MVLLLFVLQYWQWQWISIPLLKPYILWPSCQVLWMLRTKKIYFVLFDISTYFMLFLTVSKRLQNQQRDHLYDLLDQQQSECQSGPYILVDPVQCLNPGYGIILPTRANRSLAPRRGCTQRTVFLRDRFWSRIFSFPPASFGV